MTDPSDITSTRPEPHGFETTNGVDCTRCNLHEDNAVHLRTIQLPNARALEERLVAMESDPHAAAHLYPLMAARVAGRRMSGFGIALAVVGAIEEYVGQHDLPSDVRGLMSHPLSVMGFVAALTADDQAVHADVRRFFAERVR